MRHKIADLLIVFLSLFFVASLLMLSGITRQSQALDTGVEMAQITMSQDDKVRIALSHINDIDKYKRTSEKMFSGRSGVLRGITELAAITQQNVQLFTLVLLVFLTGLFGTGVAMYLRLRSYAKKLASLDGRSAI